MPFNLQFSPSQRLSTVWMILLVAYAVQLEGKSYQRDYVVFAGEDKRGKVVFALESVQSEGGRWDWTQAMETAHLYDGTRGWVKLHRGESQLQFGNKGKQIGEGKEFGVKGSLRDEMTISSDANGLLIKLRKSESFHQEHLEGKRITRSSGKASFYWKGRRVEGRAFRIRMEIGGTSEVGQLVKAANHMHQESFFLNVGELGFLQIYRGHRKGKSSEAPDLQGLLITDSLDVAITDFRLEATKWMRAGLQTLPYEWQGSFILDGQEVLFKVTSTDLKTEDNYLIHGTRVGHAKGFLMVGTRTYPLYGVSRVSHFMQGQKAIREIEAEMGPPPVDDGTSWEAIVRGYPQ